MRYLFVLLLAGCATPNWTKDGATKADLDGDSIACQKEAEEKGPGASVLLGPFAAAASARATVRECMRGRGWRE